jgi:hypothetical protein
MQQPVMFELENAPQQLEKQIFILNYTRLLTMQQLAIGNKYATGKHDGRV